MLTIFDNFNLFQQSWQFLIISDNFQQSQQFLTIFTKFYNSDNFHNFDNLNIFFYNFDNFTNFWQLKNIFTIQIIAFAMLTIEKTILETCDIWDTDSDNWEPEFMKIFVIWQLIVTLDSIRNSCDVFCKIPVVCDWCFPLREGCTK